MWNTNVGFGCSNIAIEGKYLDVKTPFYGFSGSPIIEGDLLILTANTSGIALDKKTGEKVWVSDKPPENLILANSTGTHYAVPVIYDYGGNRYAVITSYAGVHSVAVETGKVFWLYEWESFRSVQAADPLIFANKLFITPYYKKEYGCVLLDISGREPKIVWENKNMHSEISSPVVVEGYLYGVNGGPDVNYGSLRCLSVEIGEVMWDEDLRRRPISLMSADEKLIILEDDGTLHIAEATPSAYKEISSCDVLEGE